MLAAGAAPTATADSTCGGAPVLLACSDTNSHPCIAEKIHELCRFDHSAAMINTKDAEWLAQLTRFDEHAAIGNQSALRTAVRRGDVYRVARGIYLPTAAWQAMSGDARFRVLVHAASARYPYVTLSHFSAAALWRLPIIGRWPPAAEAVAELATGGRSRDGLQRHAIGVPDSVTYVDGARITNLARTVVDVAATATFSQAVAFADRALSAPDPRAEGIARPPVVPSDLQAELELRPGMRSMARRRRVLEFADGRSGSAGETLSRVDMRALGFPDPELQVAYYDDDGLIGFTDFSWPEFGLVGEFDGFGKYLREDLRAGRTVAEVVIAEKRREDRLRAQVRRVARWGWAEARTPRLLEVLLRDAGLPQRRH